MVTQDQLRGSLDLRWWQEKRVEKIIAIEQSIWIIFIQLIKQLVIVFMSMTVKTPDIF